MWPAEEGKRKTDFCTNLFFISLLKKGEEGGSWGKAADTRGMCGETRGQ